MLDRNVFKSDSIAALAAVARLLVIAKTNSGQARRVADFLLGVNPTIVSPAAKYPRDGFMGSGERSESTKFFLERAFLIAE
jgi:hypothetical protein